MDSLYFLTYFLNLNVVCTILSAASIGFSLLFFIYIIKFQREKKIQSTLRIFISLILAVILFFLPAYLMNLFGYATSGGSVPYNSTYYAKFASSDPLKTAIDFENYLRSRVQDVSIERDNKDFENHSGSRVPGVIVKRNIVSIKRDSEKFGDYSLSIRKTNTLYVVSVSLDKTYDRSDLSLRDALKGYLKMNYPSAKLPSGQYDQYVRMAIITITPLTIPDLLTTNSPFFEGSIIYFVVLSGFAVYILFFLRKARPQDEIKLAP